MNDDLSSALHDLARAAARAQATGDTLVTPDVVQRARRGRRRHDVVVGAVSAAAVTAVALTGGALAVDREPTPPAVTTTAPTPTPTPTPTADVEQPPTPTLAPTVLPGADPSAVPGACGSVLGEAPTQPDEGLPFSLDLWPVPGNVPAGEPLPVGASWSLGWYPEATIAPEDGPTFLVTHEGVVVAGGHASPAVTGEDRVDLGGLGYDAVGSLALVVCDPGTGDAVTPGRALPAGTYELHARLRATVLPEGAVDPERDGVDPDVETARAVAGSTELHLADGPVAFTVVGDALEPVPAERPAGPPVRPAPPPFFDDGCGTTPLQGAPAPVLFRLDHATAPITVGVGEPVDLGARLTYVGAGRVGAVVHDVVTYLVLRDGVVAGLGTTGPVDDISSHTVFDHGASKPAGQLDQEMLLEACSPEPVGTHDIRAGLETAWTPLAAGDYQLLPVVELWVRDAVGDEGSAWHDATGSISERVAGTPVPLTVR